MSEAAAASAYGAQPTSAPINVLSNSEPYTPDHEGPLNEAAWGDDFTPGEIVETTDREGMKYSPGVELDETAKFKPQNQKKSQENQGVEEKKEAGAEPQQLTPEQELQQLREERKNFKKGVYEKFQKAAEIYKQNMAERAQWEEVRKQFTQVAEDPLRLMKIANIPPEQQIQFIEKMANQLQAELSKTPEQRELERLKRFEAETTQKTELQQRKFQEYQEKVQEQQLADGMSKFIIEAFNKRVGLPATPERVRQMAMALSDYYDAGQPVDIERVADEVWEGFQTDVRRSLQKLPKEKLIEFIGEDNAKIIAAQLGQKFAANQHFKNHSKPKPTSAPSYEAQPKYLGYGDVEEMRRKGQI